MEEPKWTHEQLNVLEALNAGSANELVSFILEGGELNVPLISKLKSLIKDGNFSWKANNPKVGRPISDKWSDWACLNLFAEKMYQLENSPDKRVIDIEMFLSKEHGVNIDDLRKHITKGKKLYEYFVSKEGEEWAKQLILRPKK